MSELGSGRGNGSARNGSSARSEVFTLLGDEFEEVAFGHDAGIGLRAIVAIHSTVLGPGLGGVRFHPYDSETDALVDVLRLARGMTYKHAVAGLDTGGGKAVIIGDPATDWSPALIEAYARFVDGLGGRYLTAEDVGTTQADMDVIRQITPYVTGTSPDLGGSGDPSPATAWGVLWSMRAVGERLWDEPSLRGRRVVVIGVGKVGTALVDHLVREGAEVTVSDVDPLAVQRVVEQHGVASVSPERAHTVACDILSPCALGAALDSRSIPMLECRAICGAANNQLAEPDDGDRLVSAGVLYVPDYVANAGGIINISEEGGGYDQARAYARIEGILETTHQVFDRAELWGLTPAQAADRLAEERIAGAQTARSGG